jgi:LCP family protein required for cell wall assembly
VGPVIWRRSAGDDSGAWEPADEPGDAGAASGRRDHGPRPEGSARAEGASRSRRILGRHPVLSVLAIIAALAVTSVSLVAYAAYRNVYDSIHHVTVTNRMLGPRPPKLNGSTNILVIGSDSRQGTHGRYGRGVQGSRSDTSMLLHISPTHTGAIVVSFPRDSMVPIYACLPDGDGHPGQQAQPGVLEQLNATFSEGGAPCLWKTIEQTTHIHIDHFVEVDFDGFRQIVDDLGGVSVCLPYAIRDPASRLDLSAGRHVVDGAQALAFVRERHIGEGSDLQRIQRQQLFLASVAQKIKETASLTDPTRLYSLVHAVASSLTTDSGLSLTEMYAIVNTLKSLNPKQLAFISVPVVPYPPNPSVQVEYEQPQADRLFRAIAHDNRILKVAQENGKAPATTPTVSPKKVHVRVLNGTNVAGLAATTAGQLGPHGFRVTGTGNATSASSSTIIEYGPASQLPAANTLEKQIPGAEVKQVSSLHGRTIDLVLGSDFRGIGKPTKKAKQTSVAALNKTYGGIKGSHNICHDSYAFAGPDNPSMFGN